MKKTKSILSVILIAVMFCISMTSCQSESSQTENQIINFILEHDPLTLDPQIADDYSSKILITNLFEGLVKSNSDGTISPGIAKSWEISADGLEYTFHLAEDSKWSNGQALTADDFVFGITRSLSPETRADNISDLFSIKNAVAFYEGQNVVPGINSPDETTLKITLEYPSNDILHTLSKNIAMPCNEDFFESTKGKYGKDAELIITNGPFSIRETYGWEHDKYIYIRRNENYRGSNPAVSMGVNFTIAQKPASPVEAINDGETDLCEIYGDDLKAAEENALNITSVSNTLWGICYNTDIPVFKNDNLRISMLSALNRNSVLSDSPSSYVRTTQLIGNNITVSGVNYREFAGNFTLAKGENTSLLFEKALEEMADNDITLNSSYTVICLNDASSSGIATHMIETWNNMCSCYFNKQPLSRNELEERIISGDYEIAIAPLNTATDSPMEFLSKFTTDSNNNYINLNNPDYNDYISDALKTNGTDSIKSLANAENHLITYGYLYPLYYENRYFASNKKLTGFSFAADLTSIDFTKAVKSTEE